MLKDGKQWCPHGKTPLEDAAIVFPKFPGAPRRGICFFLIPIIFIGIKRRGAF